MEGMTKLDLEVHFEMVLEVMRTSKDLEEAIKKTEELRERLRENLKK